jgi:iodotyrosine deiodinase
MEKSKTIDGYPFIHYQRDFTSPEKMIALSNEFYNEMELRRSIRDFSNRPVPREVIEKIILTASTAPSGANKQPWTFCVVSNPEIKSKIRTEAEKEEKESYDGRMSEEWLEDIRPLQTNWQKPFLEIAPYLIVVFKKVYDLGEDGSKKTNYYVNESVGIACGFLLTAIHHAGLVALTHTPSPMNFLTKILDRPENERPFLLIPVGYPGDEVYVPKLNRKSLEEIIVWS